MSCRRDILFGIAFVFVGLIYALCDRWQRELTIQGVLTRKPHKFDHFFVMWALRQFLLLSLFFLWKTIPKKWLDFACFSHGDLADRGNVDTRAQDMGQLREENEDTRSQDLIQFPIDNVNTRSQDLIQLPEDNEDTRSQDVIQLFTEHVDTRSQDGSQLSAENVESEVIGENQDQIVNVDERDDQEEVPKKSNTKKPSKLIYFPPAFFALAHVLLLYFGLKLTFSTSFIMLKGTVTFFTALLTLAFLSQQLACCVWFGVTMATLGFVVSGISDHINKPNDDYENYGIAAGDLLILMSQIMFATKIIYEQKFIQKHSIHPMLFLGCEGMYGTFFAVIFLLVFNFVDAVQYSNLPNGRLEDVHDFVLQFANSWSCMLAVLGSLLSYILYTYLGMFLIKDQGALPRIMIETFVWSIYWAVCLALQWERFFIGQVPGLCAITFGVLFFKLQPCSSYFKRSVNNEQDNLNNTLETRENDQQVHVQDGQEVENPIQEDVVDDDVPLLTNTPPRGSALLRYRRPESRRRDGDQQLNEQGGPEVENLMQEDIDHDNAPLISDTHGYEADLLRH